MEGGVQAHQGVHVINDGGYHQWVATMAGEKPDVASSLILAQAGGLSESVRKDIECVFGILKRRFRVLKVPFLLSTVEQIDDIFRTCCGLHNMLQTYDGLDTIGELETDWERVDDWAASYGQPLDDNPDGLDQGEMEQDVLDQDRRCAISIVQQLISGRRNTTPVNVHTDRGFTGHQPASNEEHEYEEGYERRQEAIAIHIDVLIKKKMLYKLKTAAECRPQSRRPILGCPGPWSA